MSLAVWLTVVAGVALVVGMALFILGWRGRRLDRHPCCRRCGFDLDGLTLGVAAMRCPECGRAVGEDGSRVRRRAVRIGRRKKRPIVAAVGALLVCVVGLPGGGAAWLLWSGTNVDHYKPVWWLIHEGDSTRAITAERARDELRRRMVEDEISRGGARAVARAVLTKQAAETGWHSEWGTLFEIAWLGGWLDQSMTDQYLRNAIRFQVVRGEVEGPAPPQGLRLDLKLEDRTGELLLLRVRAALRVPAVGAIAQATAGEFNVEGQIGGGTQGVMVWGPATQTTRKSWFAGIGISPSAGVPVTAAGGGFLALRIQTEPMLPESVRLSPWPSSLGQDFSMYERTAHATQYLMASGQGHVAGAVMRLEVVVGPQLQRGNGSGGLSSWWSRWPVPVGGSEAGVRWEEELRVGR